MILNRLFLLEYMFMHVYEFSFEIIDLFDFRRTFLQKSLK